MDGNSDETGTDPVVVALGGNTLLGEHGRWTIDEQRNVIEQTARQIADAIDAGYDIVLTYGNGPQVGNLLLQQERVSETPQLPLDVLVAETQAQIGYLLQQALDNELTGPTDFMTVVTQVVVDAGDPAFGNPTKPVGPFYTEAEAAERPFETRKASTGDRPYRRVVPSPEPVEIVEGEEITRLVERGNLVIAAGGGGVPVVRDGEIRGVEAVIDKDKSSQLLASELGIDTLVVLTDVEYAYVNNLGVKPRGIRLDYSVNYSDPDQRPLRRIAPQTLRAHLEAGEFSEGSMRPKIEASLQFLKQGGERAVITSPERLRDALSGDAGTQVRA